MGCMLRWAAEAAKVAGFAMLLWRAPLMAETRDPIGVWEFSLDGAAGKCRISLRPDASSSGGSQVIIPVACLRTFPVLGPVESWSVTGEDRLALLGRTGQALLNFAAAAGVYIAVGPAGETYRLTGLKVAAEEHAPRGEQAEKLPLPSSTQRQPAVALADAQGRYSVLREGGRDTGCMLTLDVKGKGHARGKASLAPGCRDQGIVVFDPSGWEIAGSRLVLIARKGHKAHLDAQPDGSWKKDPAEGTAMSLKKL
jgi:Protease inhibitor Inh